MAGKRAGLGANPLDWIKDTTEKQPEAPPPQKPKTKKKQPAKSVSSKVQELETPTAQERGNGEKQGVETLELPEIVTREDMKSHKADSAYLESDPLYRQYKQAQAHVPKYQQLEVKLYVLLREDQLESLSRLTRQIMKNRTSEYKKERITKNTVIRALIDNLNELELDTRNIPDEVELEKRIREAINTE